MKTLLMAAAATALAAGGTTALAADMPTQKLISMATAVYPPPAEYDWTGVYYAGSLGGQWWNIDGTYVTTPADHHSTSGSKAVYGGHVGFQYQWGDWVAGIEGGFVGPFDEGFTRSLSPSADCLGGSALADRTCESRINYTWTVGGKIGWAWDEVLVYATGGYANGRIETRGLLTAEGALTSTTQANHAGWYVGAGLDWFIAKVLWTDLILGIEYQHIDLGTKLHVDMLIGATGENNRKVSATQDIARARLTWKWTPNSY